MNPFLHKENHFREQSNENHGPRRNTYPILFDVILLWILVMGFLEKGKILVDRKREKRTTDHVDSRRLIVNCVRWCRVELRSSRWNQPLFWIRRTGDKTARKDRGRMSARISKRKSRKGRGGDYVSRTEKRSARARVYIQSHRWSKVLQSQLPYRDRGLANICLVPWLNHRKNSYSNLTSRFDSHRCRQ